MEIACFETVTSGSPGFKKMGKTFFTAANLLSEVRVLRKFYTQDILKKWWGSSCADICQLTAY